MKGSLPVLFPQATVGLYLEKGNFGSLSLDVDSVAASSQVSQPLLHACRDRHHPLPARSPQLLCVCSGFMC